MIYKSIQGEKLPVIGQGTFGLGGKFTPDTSSDKEAIDIIRYGIDVGMTLIDLSELYGGGHTEEIVGKAIAGIRDKCFLVLKISPQNLKYDTAIKSIELSLKRLNTDRADLCLIHWPNEAIPIEETVQAGTKLLSDGKIRYFGVGNFTLQEIHEAEKSFGKIFFGIESEYSIFARYEEEEILPYCQENDMLFLAYSPLDKNRIQDYGILEIMAKQYNCTSKQLALKWLISKKNVIPIPKSSSKRHILENASVAELKVDEEDLKYMDVFFTSRVKEIDIQKIKADKEGLNAFIPTVDTLVKSFKRGIQVKPIRVKPVENGYELVEGKARYWAWVFAHENKKPIKALLI